ncbi:YsnF/AvaK domain-containing protein [Bacillus alkalicellulosilyticus]|uniref:YsnF/AvaK domain-containing protein n=1 Tax=Alkalihalobacterium alkalicellulosilyticum TaxID=1912214 RepID=UPI00099691E1|nr:YsnF/AvaK domain-containing protein [Bacillus alkalicellulosilyticus]
MGKYIIIGAIMGGVVGWVLNVNLFIALILGAIVAGVSYMLFSNRNEERIEETTEPDDGKMLLREEQLDITKERVQIGEVKVHKEVVEEQKTITVPLRREEMVIEAGDEEVYRIPIKEEEVQITKNPVKVNEVSITKREVEGIEQVNEMVKKETADIEIKGNADVKEKS